MHVASWKGRKRVDATTRSQGAKDFGKRAREGLRSGLAKLQLPCQVG